MYGEGRKPGLTLLTLFQESARTYPEKTAVIAHGGRISYRDLQTAAISVAHDLLRRGAKPGDRVAVWIPNSCAAAVAIWGIMLAGCAFVPVHAASRLPALRGVLGNAEPRWVLSVPEFSGTFAELTATIVGLEEVVILAPLQSQTAPCTDHIDLPSPRQSDLAAIIYTSGSTGEPKGVMLTHGNMLAAVHAVNAYLGIVSQDVIYSPLPLSSSYGLYQLILGLAAGASVLLDRSFAFPASSLALMSREKATVLAGVPTMFAQLAKLPSLEAYDLSRLRLMTSAAAALPVQHASILRRCLPSAHLFIMYGQTECKRISYLHPDHLDAKPGSVGRGMPFQEHAVVDESGVSVPAGGVGELVVRGPHVMQGYWRNETETRRKLRPRPSSAGLWLYTGDQFRIDEDGFLYFLGRSDEVMKIGGHKVSPCEIEEVLNQLPEVVEAAVTGRPDEVWGEVAEAYLVLHPGATCSEEAVLQFCSQRLRQYMVPRFVWFIEAMPRTESGKTKKSLLRNALPASNIRTT